MRTFVNKHMNSAYKQGGIAGVILFFERLVWHGEGFFPDGYANVTEIAKITDTDKAIYDQIAAIQTVPWLKRPFDTMIQEIKADYLNRR